MKMTTDTLLTPPEVWSAKIYSNDWRNPGLGTADVTGKATGAKLGEIGIPSPEGVSPIRRFLIPIDALEVKPVDLKPILEVAERFNAEVTLLHCYEIPPSFDYAIGPSALMEVTLHRDMAKTRLLKLCTEVRKFFAKCRCEFAVGSLPVEILRASDTLHADLIVVPLSLDLVSHSWTTKELLDELVRKANCSVLEIPVASRGVNIKILETERSSDKLVSKKRVVVAVDLTKHSEATAHYAAQIAKWFNASLYIAHVFSPPPWSEFGSEDAYNVIDQERREVRARLDQLTEQVHQVVSVCESVYLEGEPEERISALASDLGADLIITASHHPTFLARLFNLDKAPKIMHRAPCPVLVYHQENT